LPFFLVHWCHTAHNAHGIVASINYVSLNAIIANEFRFPLLVRLWFNFSGVLAALWEDWGRWMILGNYFKAYKAACTLVFY
jgi:hypothetical protein